MRKRIVTLDINTGTYKEAMEKVLLNASHRTPSYACFANAHMTVEAYQDESFRQLVNNSFFSFPDGMPLVFALRILYGIKQERVAGMDFMLDAVRESEEKNLSVFFFGSTEEVLSSLRKRLVRDFPKLKIVGVLSPPFRNFSDEDNDGFIESMNSSGAHLIFVSLGCPKQEKWMATHYHRVPAIMLGVGGAFPVVAGITSRAPLAMRKLGLEWLYRLYQEPRRLFKRYLITNSMFIYLIFKQRIFK